MTIENRDLAPGTKLVASYKKTQHRCEVTPTPEGVRYKLEDKRLFTSLSSAGKAVTGRVSCDGWKFWSLDGEPAKAALVEAPQPKDSKPAAPKMVRQIKKLANQKGVAESSTKFFCSGCMASFTVEGSEVPETCTAGHLREVEDGFGDEE